MCGTNWYKKISWVQNWWYIFFQGCQYTRGTEIVQHVLVYLKDNINRWEKYSFPFEKGQQTDIIWIYWGIIH